MKAFPFLITMSLFLFSNISFSQSTAEADLYQKFTSYELTEIDAMNLYQKVSDKSKFHNVKLTIGNEVFDLELWDSDLRKEDFKIYSLSPDKTEVNSSEPLALKGKVNGASSSNVRLTVNDGFLYGYIKFDDKRLNIQPARYMDDSFGENDILSYYDSAIIPDENEATCQLHKHEDYIENTTNITEENRVAGDCFEVEIALAADWLMFDSYGSIGDVEDQITGVLNDVQGNYDDEFADEISYFNTEIFVSDCSSCDPWTSSTDASTLLNSFRSWGPGNFGGHDVATLWTDRDFDGGTVGVAYVGVICTGSRYNTCQDFTNSSWQLRVLMAHELGHNWDALHDGAGSGFIMAPSVNNSDTWSSNSISDIENHLSTRNCLTSCTVGTAPTADFDYDIIEPCVQGEVEFEDISGGSPTSWFWTFEGGNPSTSTDENPVVTYNSVGTYDVTLEVENSFGDDEITISDVIEIQDLPDPDFFTLPSGLTMTFENITPGGTNNTYFWNFGDGNTSSMFNPVHTYNDAGIYDVNLEAFNACGTEFIVIPVSVYDDPFADFTANNTLGCTPMSVTYDDLSTGLIDSWNWTFEGGTPATSTLENPTIVYNTEGTYDVTLEVTNQEGTSTLTIDDYIVVLDLPTADFSYTVNGSQVSFTNTSSGATSYVWNFGDGNTSTNTNPVHTYGGSGTYSVELLAGNTCGSLAHLETIIISLEPVAQFTTQQSTVGCATYTIDYTDESAGNPTSWNWTFPGGSPSSSSDQNPSVSYSSAGTYDVTLEVTNANGSDELVENDYVVINDVPSISASFSSNVLTVDFTSNISDADSFFWDFGDGNTSTTANPVHVYSMEGNYVATLSATNGCGTVTETLNIALTEMPSAGFNSGATIGCKPFTVMYSDNSSDNVQTWNWTFEGGTPATSTDQNPIVTYNDAGTFDVSLTVGNASGTDMISSTNYITVGEAPVADFDFSVNGNVVSLINNTPGTMASWTTSDGAAYASNTTTHTFAENGNYTITLVVSNDCGSDEVTFDVSISAYPVASFGLIGSATGCLPYTIDFENSSDAGSTYAWTFDGGSPGSSTDENPSITYNAAGTYDVTLVVSNQYGSDEIIMSDAVTIFDIPTGSFSSSVSGSVVNFTSTISGANSYEWDFGDGGSSNLENPSHSYQNPDNYTVTLKVENDCGELELEEEIDVNFTTPGIAANFSSDFGCAPLEVTVTDQSTNDPVSWDWSFPGGTPASSNDQNPVVNYDTPGTYSITAVIANADGSSMFTFTDAITVIDVPVADFNLVQNDATIDLTNASSGATSYVWNFGDGNMSNEENPSHTYTASGDYIVTLEATNECGTTITTTTVVVIISGVEDLLSDVNLNIIPNPNDGNFVLRFDQPISQNATYQIIDMLGRVIKKGVINQGVEKIGIYDLESRGTHLIKLQVGDKYLVKKLLIL